MKPLNARMAAGRGRAGASASEYAMTAPCEKPPTTSRSAAMRFSSRTSSSQPESSAKVCRKVSRSGEPTSRNTYQ
jgi:hypothetical protein